MTLAQYLQWYDEVVGPTKRMMRMVPSDRLEWQLTPKSFSLGQLIAHIARSWKFGAIVMSGREAPLKNLREILVLAYFHQFLRNIFQ